VKRIGILGGTFNPVHIGHLAVAQIVCDALKLDKVLFIPSFYPPHKSREHVLSVRHRAAMVQLAIKDNPKFKLNDFEIKHPRKSYSIHTLQYLHKFYPAGTKFYFIVGSDMLPGLKNWRRIDELSKLTQFIVVSRKGFKPVKTGFKVRTIPTLDLGISSSYLRRCLKEKKTVKYLLPEGVLAYIKKHKLYLR